jgi:hypothetical protein
MPGPPKTMKKTIFFGRVFSAAKIRAFYRAANEELYPNVWKTIFRIALRDAMG